MYFDQKRIRFPGRPATGFTLVELLAVLAILGMVGGMVVMTVSRGMTVTDGAGRTVTSEEAVTRTTLREVEKALLGYGNQAGYHAHNLELPTRIAGLLIDVDNRGAYDFATKRGWNGPYLFDTGARYGDVVESGDNFTTAYGTNSDPAILDGWGKPIILQQPDSIHARLVSAGPNHVLETDPNDAIDSDRGDDLVRFLRSDDPNL